jgi:acetyl-CoA carboxylase beta subunit
MSYPKLYDGGVIHKKKGTKMNTFIHCHHCQEDMNSADWEANSGRCLHCDSEIDVDWNWETRRRNPINRLRHRLEIMQFVRNKPAYV